MTEAEMIQIALDEGFSAAAIVDVGEIVFNPEFRKYCAENLCGQYNANYTCPPDCGSVEEMQARILARRRALVVQTKWEIASYSDSEAIADAKQMHNQAMLRCVERFRSGDRPGVMAGASCCRLCKRCGRITGEACPHPQLRFSCMSAYCIHVKKLTDACGMDYCLEPGWLALFGMYAF